MPDISISKIIVENQEVSQVPEQGSGYLGQYVECSNGAKATWDNNAWSLNTGNLYNKTECKIYFVKNENYQENYTPSGTNGTSNPATGAFINIFLIIAIIGIAYIAIKKAKEKKKFFRV